MSAYQTNTFKFHDSWYDLVEGSPFSPREYGIGPYDSDTYTPLGYSASFCIVDRQLHLLHLYTNHNPDDFLLLQQQENEEQEEASASWPDLDDSLDALLRAQPRRKVRPPEINGVDASPASSDFWNYTNVNLPINYSGTLVIDRMPIITGDESEHYIRQAIKDIVESGSRITRWSLQFENGKLVAETPHDPDSELDELIQCYGVENSIDDDTFLPFSPIDEEGGSVDLEPVPPFPVIRADDNDFFDDFDIDPPGAGNK